MLAIICPSSSVKECWWRKTRDESPCLDSTSQTTLPCTPPPVRAKTSDPQAPENDHGLYELLECAYCITLLFDEKYLLPFAVLIREYADVTKFSEFRWG